MEFIIIIFGLALLLMGAIIAIHPETVFGFLRNNLEKIGMHVTAVVLRIIIGILLIVCAGESKFPCVMEILGWLSIAAAVILWAIGRRRFLALMTWAFSFAKRYGRVAGLGAMVFGGFLIYAFV